MSQQERRTLIHILDARIQRQRLRDMKNAAMRKKIPISETFRPEVTHVVTEFTDIDAVVRKLNITDDFSRLNDVNIVSVQWFTDCLRSGHVVDVEPRHRIQQTSNDRQSQGSDPVAASSGSLIAEFGCQRATPLKHYNEKFTKALEVLEKHADLREGDHDYSRSLAFRRASCVLKSLPAPLTNIDQLRNVTNIGDHCKRILQEILEEGESSEVQAILNDHWFHKMKLFNSIFGIGPSYAKKFIANDWSTIEEVQNGYKSGDWRVKWGLGFYDDLTTPVLRTEAHYIQELVQKHLNKILPGNIMTVTGGFRRGKPSGHDVDLLITHPQEDKVNSVLVRLLQSLESTDTVLCGKYERSTYNPEILSGKSKLTSRGQLDHFEKWIGIIKVPKKVRDSGQANGDNNDTDLTVNGTSATSSNGDNTTTNNGVNSFDTTQVLYSRTGDQTHSDSTPHDNLNGSIDSEQLTTANATKGSRPDKSPLELAREDCDWLARRVDLIIAPYSQYYYALVGWTGSKQFNRDARLYAERKLNMVLSSHGLYDKTLGRSIPATSEKEVLDNLQLPYHDPCERNC